METESIATSLPSTISLLSSTKDLEVSAILYDETEKPDAKEHAEFKHTWSIWCIFFVLALLSFLTALDGTIITTSLPIITRAIGGGDDQLYVWIANCFLFSSTAFQPLYGQIANIFGRRNPFLAAIVLFAFGSGLAGGASSVAMLIAGRTVQGLGAAGLYVLSDILICDLVPPRNRGPYLSAVLSAAGLGSTIGPIMGGAIAEDNWRWIFYLNVPISALAFLVMFFLLKVNYTRNPTWAHALARVDFLGAIIFIPSIISLFYALTTGGIQYPWSSWRILTPLILGLCGWALFHVHQATPSICPNPSTPPHIFTNRTSATGFALIFLSSVLLYTIAYFLPLYFQAVKLVSPVLSGVYYLPFALAIMPFAGFGGWALSQWGKYVPLHYAGFALLTIGTGLFSTLDASSSRAAWIGLQVLPSAGIALIFTATLPSTLAQLKEEDVAAATATYSFVRSFGFVWGMTMAAIIFNWKVDQQAHLITDTGLQERLRSGAAYSFASSLGSLENAESLAQCIDVYTRALRVVWLAAMGVALLGFLCVGVERSVELKKSHDTKYGLAEEDSP
jgi:hypothetical protein